MGTEALTKTEIEIIKMISKGYKSPKIAILRDRSVRTIDAHRQNIMRKLDVNNAKAMLEICEQQGIIKIN